MAYSVLNFDAIQVGDEIGLDTSPSHNHGMSITTVARRTKTTVTLASGRKFNKYCEEMKSENVSYPRARILKASVIQTQLDGQAADKATRKAMQELLDKVAGQKTGQGDFCVNEEVKNELIVLVCAIPTNRS